MSMDANRLLSSGSHALRGNPPVATLRVATFDTEHRNRAFPRGAWERGKRGGYVIFVLAAMLLPSLASAQDQKSPEIVGVRVGIDNRYKAGLWTQVEVTLRGGGDSSSGEVSVLVPDGDGVPGRVSTPPTQPCQLSPSRETTVRLITRFGQVHGELKAQFRVDGRVIASRTFDTATQADAEHFLPAIENQKLVVVVGGSSLGMEDTGKLAGLDPEHRPVAACIDDIERLPTQCCGYEGVDAVVLSTSRPEIYRKLAADSSRMQAIDQWVRLGGRLVLCAGSRAEEILAQNSPLRQFAPGRLVRMQPLKNTEAIETYCGSRHAAVPTGGIRISLRVPRLAGVQGTVEAAEADLPLIVRTARGFGQVIFVAADLDQAPFDRWTDRPLLMARLLDMPTTRAEASNESTAMMHYGYNDLAGQLRSALDSFAGVQLIPFWLVAGLIVVYILLIGPGDYFFLRKIVGRMTWTWVTFPAIVIVVCVAAYVLAHRLKGDQLRVNQIDLVDVDAASGQMRGATWLDVFSPRMESFNFAVEPKKPDGAALPGAKVWTAWLGLPGNALGGMNQRGAGPLLWNEEFRYAENLDALYGMPIQVWATKSLTARWTAPGAACPAAELAESDELLSGSITNTLPFSLRGCIVAYGRSAYDLGSLEPGQVARLAPTTKRSELKTLLTGYRAVFTEGDKSRQEATPYDQSSTDLAGILRTMMFYSAAGGRRYAGLWNDYQSFVDLSDLLKADRAILIAQKPVASGPGSHGAELLRDGRSLAGSQDRHETMYRFVFPVKK